jgi:hypothetical protein
VYIYAPQAYIYAVSKEELEELGLVLVEAVSDGSDDEFNEDMEYNQRGAAAAAGAAAQGEGEAEEPQSKGGLIVDNKKSGNISRFINCCWAREAAHTHINVQAAVCWNVEIKRPVLSLVRR